MQSDRILEFEKKIEQHIQKMDIPVFLGSVVTSLKREADYFSVRIGHEKFDAHYLVIATGVIPRRENLIASENILIGPGENISSSNTMTITSSAFTSNGAILKKYTCDGTDINPPLTISGVPAKTKSLVLIVDDPDAPDPAAPKRVWAHWILWNIDPTTTTIPEGSIPKGASEGITSFGKPGYGGPCPPSGIHRYFFKLYALDTTLSFALPPQKSVLEAAMEGHTLGHAELIGLYERGK